MKRIVALLLAAVMLFGLCACSGGTASTTETASAPESIAAPVEESAATEVEAPPEAPAEETSAQEPAEEVPAVDLEATYVEMYPVKDEGVELTFMINLGGFVFQFLENGDLNETLAAQVQEEETGIHVEYQGIDQDAYADKLLLMIASEDYTDMCATPEQHFPGGIDGLVDQDIMLNLNEYMDNMPHLEAFGQEHPEFIKSMTSDAGNMVSVYNYVPDTDYCLLYRKDLLEQVGLDIPTTYDELYEVLTAIKEQTDVKVPLAIANNGFVGGMQGGAALSGGFDIVAPTEEDLGWTVDDDGNVVCSAVSDNMREYLEMWSKWYAEGLMTQDFISQTSNREQEIISGECGVAYNMMTCVSDTQREEYGITMVTGPDIVKAEGDIIHTGVNEHPTNKGSGSIGVTTACENPEAACQWLNWFFTDKGRETYNFGVQGQTYELDEDGVPYYTDLIMNSELGVGPGLATSMVIGWAAMPFPRYTERTAALYTNDEEKGMYEMWVANRDNAHVYFGDLTQEENEKFSATASDILTVVSEAMSGFIMGTKSLDDWDEYVQQCYDMGLQELIDLKQDAYNRYLER